MLKTDYLSQLRQRNPLIHNITNIVVANYVANGLLALGASPIMSSAVEEMDELPAICQALVINIGTLTAEQVKAMLIAGKAANRHGIPVVLDPVGVGATRFRQQTVAQLLQEIQFSAIRGNAGEMAYLANVNWQTKGVDVGQGDADLDHVAKKIAQQHRCTAVISGAVDVISDGKQLAHIQNGTPLFPHITGSGCLLSAVCGAFLAVAQQHDFPALVEAATAYTIAGELAAKNLQPQQYGQFYTALLDKLATLDSTQVQQLARIDDD
ncbi:hydroxyethylthiazole kinase [Testudinibacter sp. TR-2022]|uniref:hydroxyethylthiazole kinase n=1 Tax=Testudinibacter sp. TR-2022 TaxID=2585029 RepID=UPI001119D50F|nr:hydroxyethylthiazole kinase [Testudinibacter sp. TR-2022]TNH05248.1 hydroxyethylthiazole kinase [Pasteurellaceae bacterium Phil11]TNH24276.1 hydroxyethylthiazole kinase [Testudinibacter sp. TR-2022]TNH26867.1 hydroxyethylthiazole kinase [Testudinibacter sp. TR-2022]